MKPLQIGRRRLSHVIWQVIDEKTGHINADLMRLVTEHHAKRDQAEHETGSIGLDDVLDLYKVAKFFQPKIIAEVGTYVGTSTMALLVGWPTAEVYTCDVSNSVDLSNEQIHQYHKKHSYEMFADMAEKGLKADLIYLDGRLSNQDVEPLSKIIHDRTVFVMDDFEGVEKGVTNAMMLESTGRMLVYPRDKKKTAMSIPLNSILQFSPQELI